MKKVLGPEFFDRSTLVVAKDLLGKYLVRKINGKEIALLITETEAYHGFNDLASHASRGPTPRNMPMFEGPGTIYIFFTYGMHWMLNFVCGPKDFPAAILIRGAGDIIGPARLTKFLKIDKSLNGTMLGKKSGLWVEDRGVKLKSSQITKGPRVNVDYAGPWAAKPWRFILGRTDQAGF
jgi:DNA-3-methyladenine glycosylase